MRTFFLILAFWSGFLALLLGILIADRRSKTPVYSSLWIPVLSVVMTALALFAEFGLLCSGYAS